LGKVNLLTALPLRSAYSNMDLEVFATLAWEILYDKNIHYF